MDETQEKSPRVKDLFVWKSLSHPVAEYPKGTFSLFGAIAVLVSIVLILFGEWFAILAVWATYFLFFTLTKLAPVAVDHKITTEGIISMGKAYLWVELGPFWFSQRHGEIILHVAGTRILNQLAVIINPEDKEKIIDILAGYLPYIEVPEKSFSDKVSDWFSKKLLSKV